MSREFPDTSLLREATQLAQGSLPSPILAHSRRTFLLGRAYAREKRISLDEEDLLLAALFHDLGLSDAYADRRKAFTEIGADLLEQFLSERGDAARGRCLAEAIDLHMQLFPRWSRGPVVGLLQVGAWMDASRRKLRTVGQARVAEIEAAYPRADFDPEFRRRLLGSLGSLRACTHLLFPRARPSAPASSWQLPAADRNPERIR